MTWFYQSRQTRIAALRERIALFEKRYAKLKDAEELVRRALNFDKPEEPIDDARMRLLQTSLDESRFLLSSAKNFRIIELRNM